MKPTFILLFSFLFLTAFSQTTGEVKISKWEDMNKFERIKIYRDAHTNSINTKAEDISGIDLNGNNFNLSDLKGKLVILHFGLTYSTCVPAEFMANELKYLEKIIDKDKIEIVSIYAQTKKNQHPKWLKDQKHTTIFKGKEEIRNKFKLISYPRILILDTNGVIKESLHQSSWKTILDAALRQMKKPRA